MGVDLIVVIFFGFLIFLFTVYFISLELNKLHVTVIGKGKNDKFSACTFITLNNNYNYQKIMVLFCFISRLNDTTTVILIMDRDLKDFFYF